MTYTPTNIAAYVNSYAGAISGMTTSGWLVDPVTADYATVTQIAGAFAQAFDTVWNDAATLNWLEIQAISQVVSENFAHRSPGPLTEPRFMLPSNWAETAAACAALVLQSDAFFAGQGINPGTPGGGGGGTISQLSNVIFVDRQGSGAAMDGSIANPYQLVQEAVDAAAALGPEVTNVTIYMTPWDYTGPFGDVNLPVDKAIAFIGMDTKTRAILPNINCPGTSCSFENCNVAGIVADTSEGGFVEFYFTNADCATVHGNASYVYGFGPGLFNGFIGTISGLDGTFTTIDLAGYNVVTPGTVVTCQIIELSNAAVFVCQEVTGLNTIIIDDSSFNGSMTGSGISNGRCVNGVIGAGTMTGFSNNTTDPFYFLNTQMFNFVVDCADNAIAMDAVTQTFFGKITGIGGSPSRTTGVIASMSAGEMGFKSGVDADITYNFQSATHVIIGEDVVTAARVVKLATLGGVDKQLFVIDNYGQAGTVTVEKALDNSPLFVFPISIQILRATFRITNAAGNDLELLSVEKLTQA